MYNFIVHCLLLNIKNGDLMLSSIVMKSHTQIFKNLKHFIFCQINDMQIDVCEVFYINKLLIKHRSSLNHNTKFRMLRNNISIKIISKLYHAFYSDNRLSRY